MKYSSCIVEEAKSKEKLISLRIKGSVLHITAECRKDERQWMGFCLAYKHKIIEDREAYFIEPDTITEKSGKVEMSCSVDLKAFHFRSTNWSVYTVYKEDGVLYGCRILRPKNRKRLMKDFCHDGCFVSGGNVIFAYYNRNGTANIRYREKNEYDGTSRRAKEVMAMVIYRLRRNHYDRMNIALLFEKRCAKAQDNSYYLFCHAMENDMEKKSGRKICYVIKKDAPDYRKIEKYGKNVVEFMSIRHMIYLLACKDLISSESRDHAYAWQCRESIITPSIDTTGHVFLQHGILALKRLTGKFTKKFMKSELVTVSSSKEAAIVRDWLGFDESEIADTGYARFDALEDMSSQYREILLMPTFRPWVFGVERSVFVESDFYSRYMELINSPELARILEENRITLNMYQHPSIAEHTDAFHSTCPNVRIVHNGEMPLDDLMMRCSMLITDYSSIVWDVLYMNKPAVFYQYDREKYDRVWGSYIDLETELPGENVTDCASLIAAIESYVVNGFRMKEQFSAGIASYYSHMDRNNCRRIWKEINSRNGKQKK